MELGIDRRRGLSHPRNSTPQGDVILSVYTQTAGEGRVSNKGCWQDWRASTWEEIALCVMPYEIISSQITVFNMKSKL